MCLVNCPFAAIADKSQIFQLIQAIRKGDKVIACVAPAFVGQFGKDATPPSCARPCASSALPTPSRSPSALTSAR